MTQSEISVILKMQSEITDKRQNKRPHTGPQDGPQAGRERKCIESIADMLKPEKLTISTYLTVNWTQSITLQNVTVLTKN